MPSKLEGNWTIKQLMDVTYRYFRNRFRFMKRDVINSSIKIRKIEVYDGKVPGKARTKFIVETSSYPQYKPYFTGKDKRGRTIRYQRTYRHHYDTILQMDRLSLNVPVKYRCGANKRWIDRVSRNLMKSKKNPRGKYLSVGDFNIKTKGINPDFYFRVEYIAYLEGCLFGRPYAVGMPDTKTNKWGVPFLSKHAIWVVKTLMEKGILKDD